MCFSAWAMAWIKRAALSTSKLAFNFVVLEPPVAGRQLKDTREMLRIMAHGQRLKDLADLPLDRTVQVPASTWAWASARLLA